MFPKKKVKVVGKVEEIRMQRDLFGRLLGIALDQDIDLEKVLCYPLTPVPLSLCHVDGTMCTTSKSKLLELLEKKMSLKQIENGAPETDNFPPCKFDSAIIDGFFMLHTLKDMLVGFGSIAIKILKVLLAFDCNNITVAFDTYRSPSIKDNEHARRQTSEERNYTISGPGQKLSKDFAIELRNINFKQSLITFLLDYWTCEEMAPFFGTKTLYVNYEVCHKFQVQAGKVQKTVVESLCCPEHEEADTKIVYHATQLDYLDGQYDDINYNLLIRCCDTDILVIMLGNIEHVKKPMQIWMELGVGNAHRYINITKLHTLLGPTVCSALPALHALTGCDYNPAFYRKGKKKPFELLATQIMKMIHKISQYSKNSSADYMAKRP